MAAAVPCFDPPDSLPRAYASTRVSGTIKAVPEDFRVDECLGYELEGDGPHAWLQIRKRGANTHWVAQRVAQVAGARLSDVGYAGLKDRVAVTTQWFSVSVEGREEPDWQVLDGEQLQVLEVTRNRRKLRRGAFAGNRFTIRVSALRGDASALQDRVRVIAAAGAPNYFGPQRFGRNASNVEHAWQMLTGGARVRDRHRRSLLLSTARSLLFNRVLARRVSDASWHRVLTGEVVMLDGSNSVFSVPEPDSDIEARANALDLHPTGPLWGKGSSPVSGEALMVETEALSPCGDWLKGLERLGLGLERRALRVRVANLQDKAEGGALELSFELRPGAYATSVLREIVDAHDEPGD